MKINIIYGSDNADKAKGIGVVIDVFRAFSTACYLFQAGAKEIIPVKTVSEAYQLKKKNPHYVFIGEQNGKKIKGFDLGNSPFEIKNTTLDLKGKTFIHLTTCGTIGLKNATNCTGVITAAFVNISAIARFIRQKNLPVISLICTGTNSQSKDLDEDHLCALYLIHLLRKKQTDSKKVFDYLKKSPFSSHFFYKEVKSHPEEDFYYCLDFDRFDFVLKLDYQGKLKKLLV